MPATYTETTNLREIMRITPSAAYELLLSLGTAHMAPPRHQAWAARVQAALDPALLADVHFFYGELWHSMALLELPVDYPGAVDDVDGFIDYVAGLDPDTFLFYLWGRVIPREQIPVLRADPRQIPGALFNFYEDLWPGKGAAHIKGKGLPESAADPEGFQRRLITLLREYHERLFSAELPGLRERWAASVAEKQATLAQLDPMVFLSRLEGGHVLPPMFPPGVPLGEIRLVPSYFIWQASFQIWGYGSIVILYDANLTEERARALDQAAQHLSQVAAALADTNRLKILRSINQDQEVYGHKLARLCGISQPAISRHMGILKRAGLVDEVPSDGRVLYRLRRAAIEELAPQLLRYLDE
jgi:DNA-binding transcriptional ArsR family regulator